MGSPTGDGAGPVPSASCPVYHALLPGAGLAGSRRKGAGATPPRRGVPASFLAAPAGR